MMRIGMLTSGGDCQALNAAMRGVVKGLSANVDELEVYGFENGYKGLIYGNYRLLTSADFSGILTKGGTILGSSRQPFKLMRTPDEQSGLYRHGRLSEAGGAVCRYCRAVPMGHERDQQPHYLSGDPGYP